MKRGIASTVSAAVNAAIGRAQATADDARRMVINRDKVLADLDADTATLGDAIAAAGTEHANMRTEWEAAEAALSQRLDDIQLTPGPAGKDGQAGADGLDGADGRDGIDGLAGSDGADGKNGVNGSDGKDGTNGKNGSNGLDGLNAYQIARAAGYGGTQAQWLASLTGAKGDMGDPGPAGTPNLQIEYRDGVAVPAITSLLGISASVDVTITWPTPFADAAYVVTPQINTTAATLIGKTAVALKSKTNQACTVTVTSTALLSTGQATISAVAYRKG